MAGIYGADVSTPVSVEGWQTLIKERSVSFGVVRCYDSSGEVEANAPASVKNGWAAKLSAVDVYHFPCLRVDAATQVQQAVSALQNAGAKFGTYWFDVESGAGWSTTDCASNSAFLASLCAAAAALGLRSGSTRARTSGAPSSTTTASRRTRSGTPSTTARPRRASMASPPSAAGRSLP